MEQSKQQRRTARIAGWLMASTFLTAILSALILYDPVLNDTGYILGKPYWGHGYATEACRAMVELARARGDRRIASYCHADHAPSAHVLEKAGLIRSVTKRETRQQRLPRARPRAPGWASG